MRLPYTFLAASLIASNAVSAGTQQENQVSVREALTDTVTLGYIVGSAIVGYLIAVVFTALTVRIGYPPNVARFGCWVGASLWLLSVAYILFCLIMHTAVPAFVWGVLAAVLLFFGVMLYLTRHTAAGR